MGWFAAAVPVPYTSCGVGVDPTRLHALQRALAEDQTTIRDCSED